jgi:hypothetical protein
VQSIISLFIEIVTNSNVTLQRALKIISGLPILTEKTLTLQTNLVTVAGCREKITYITSKRETYKIIPLVVLIRIY